MGKFSVNCETRREPRVAIHVKGRSWSPEDNQAVTFDENSPAVLRAWTMGAPLPPPPVSTTKLTRTPFVRGGPRPHPEHLQRASRLLARSVSARTPRRRRAASCRLPTGRLQGSVLFAWRLCRGARFKCFSTFDMSFHVTDYRLSLTVTIRSPKFPNAAPASSEHLPPK